MTVIIIGIVFCASLYVKDWLIQRKPGNFWLWYSQCLLACVYRLKKKTLYTISFSLFDESHQSP